MTIQHAVFRTAILLCMCISSSLFAAISKGPVSQQKTLLSLTPHQTTLSLPVSKGTYVAGQATSPDEFSLCLADDKLHCERQLVSSHTGTAWFYLVAPVDSPVLQAKAKQNVQITLLKQVPRNQQTFNQPDISSPAVLNALRALQQQKDTDTVWQTLIENGAPLIEPSSKADEYLLTFLHRGAKHNALIFGAPDRDHGWMARLGNTDIWYKTYVVPDTTVVSYQIAPDVPRFEGSPFEQRVALKATARRDPLNPHTTKPDTPDPYMQFSVVTLPNAAPYNACDNDCKLTGTSQTFTLFSQRLNNHRQITLYTSPDNQHPADRLQLLLFDGVQFTTEINVLAALEQAVINNRIPAVDVVLIDTLDNATRGQELPDNSLFTQMLVEELLPEVYRLTGRAFTAEQRILAGSSYGGLGAFIHAFKASETFGNAIVMSGSFWWAAEPGYPSDRYFVSERVMASAPQKVRYAMTAGLFESSPTGKKGILSGSRHLRDILKVKGYEVHYKEYAGGHDYVIWERALVWGIEALFPYSNHHQ